MAAIISSTKSGSTAILSQKEAAEPVVLGDVEDSSDTDGSLEGEDSGTVADRRDMFISMLGFASTVMASWEILLPFFAFSLIDGGTALLFWGFIAVAIAMLFIYASIAEIASMAPTAGGQYHYVSELAPPKAQKLLSFTIGWLTAVGWQTYLAGVCFMTATVTQGLIALNVENYEWHNWHGTLLAIGFVLFSVAFNSVFAAQLPIVASSALVLHLVGPFAIGITLWATAPLSKPHAALFEFSNNGGWPTNGLTAMIGLITPVSVLNGYDCSVHMSEEIRDASLTLPRAIMASVGLNSTLLLFMIVTLIFTVGDVNSILQTSTGQPFIQVFFNATQSYAATNVMTVVVIILLASSCISEVATTSRQIWSFARDEGLPFSTWLSHVSPTMKVPLRAVCISIVLTSLLACINLGSTTALNAINALGVVAIMSSYFIVIGCMVLRRLRGPPLPARRWSLGRYGLVVNVVALLCVAPLWVFAFWPLARPVTPQNMNWASAMFGGTVVLVSVYYVVRGRRRYRGPVVFVKRDI